MTDVAEVLSQFDEAQADFRFPDLNHGYYYAIDCRLHAFGDAERWALVVELVGYSPRAGNVVDVFHYFGNCLTSGRPGYEDEDFMNRVDNYDDLEDSDEPETFRGSTPVVVRGESIEVSAEPGAELVDVFRELIPKHRELLFGDEPEVRRRIPADLPKLLRLEAWHQPDLFETAPSAAEVYRQLAEVLVHADASRYRPTKDPNTEWSNWPESGSL